MDLFSNNYDVLHAIELPRDDTLLLVDESFEIKNEGLYSIYITFCSTNADDDVGSKRRPD